MIKLRYIFGLLCVLFPTSTACAAPYVVAEARGIAMPVGGVIDSSATIDLKPGQHLVLISPTGQTIKLDGPYRRSPAAERGVELAAAFSSLLTEKNARTSEIGTTRGATAKPDLPQPWLIDASESGTACLRQNGTPVLWRPSNKQAANLVIAPTDRSWKAEVKWPVGSSDLELKEDMGVHGDASYFIVLNGSEYAISIVTIPAVLNTDRMRAAWMIQKGCDRQAEALLRTLK